VQKHFEQKKMHKRLEDCSLNSPNLPVAQKHYLFLTPMNIIQINLRWFRQLCDHFRVHGEAYFLYKPKGKSRTFGLSGDDALRQLKKGLHNPHMTFIYHCYNHYFCPIGYDDSPVKAVDAYR